MTKREHFIDHLESVVHLHHSVVLDIGCGDGSRTKGLADASQQVIAIDPDVKTLERAHKEFSGENVKYVHADALKLPFPSASFDVTIFTMSFHHLPTEEMGTALKEALRVTRRGGYVAFLEPDFGGSIYEADREFGTGDGDIRDVKAYAYHLILTEEKMEEIDEFVDSYTYSYKDVDDFKQREHPQFGHRSDWQAFLADHKYKLDGDERLSIFRKR